jgi:hypothetical protein
LSQKSGKFCSDGGQDSFTDYKDEKIKELLGDTGMVPSGAEVLKYETIPQVTPEIIERDNTPECLLTGDGTVSPSKESGVELIHASLPSSEKNKDLHKDTGKCELCRYVLTESDATCNLEQDTGAYPLHITLPKSGETELLPIEIENSEHHEDVCIKNGVFSPSGDICTNSYLGKNVTSFLEKKVSTSQLEYCAEFSPKENEAIKSLSDEIEKVDEFFDDDNLPGCTTVIGTSKGACKNDTTITLEYVGTETSDGITKIKPSEDILTEVSTDIPLEDVTSHPGIISTKYGTHPPDDLSIENLKDILPEEGITISCLKTVGTELCNICICERKDGSSSSAITEILVEHIDNITFESISTDTNIAVLPSDVSEEKLNNEANSLSSPGSNEIPVFHIENDLSEGICVGSGADLPPEVVSTKHVPIEEDAQLKLASTASQNVDDAALLDEKSEGLTFPSKPVEYILPEPLISNFGTDPDMWAPPELAENETQLQSVGNEEEKEDESKYGMNFLRPKIEDEVNEKAMVEIMNGEFKQLLKRFMVAEGFFVPVEAGDEGAPDSWLRVMRVLSWQAALLIKPNLVAGKEMDPSLYVKVKCIASGTRIQRLAFTL